MCARGEGQEHPPCRTKFQVYPPSQNLGLDYDIILFPPPVKTLHTYAYPIKKIVKTVSFEQMNSTLRCQKDQGKVPKSALLLHNWHKLREAQILQGPFLAW